MGEKVATALKMKQLQITSEETPIVLIHVTLKE